MAKKILVVDDELGLVKIITASLKNEGYEVVSAFNGEDGVKKAQQEKPDLIIMDIIMPKMTGGDAVRILRADANMKDIPIIFLSAVTSNIPKGIDFNGVNIDGQYYTAFSKPFDPVQLLFQIKKLL